MPNFNRDSRRGGDRPNRGFGGGSRGFNDRGQGRPQMHQAVCNDCGKECEVPFRPTGDRPIYCSTCFENHRDSSSDRPRERSFDRPSFGDKRMFQAVCTKCGKACEVPFRPSGDKPVFCNQCFDKNDRPRSDDGRSKSPDQFKAQFDMLNAKLDKIMKALNLTTAPGVLPVAKPAKEVKIKEKKTVVKAKAAPKKAVAKKKK
ncbi:MAG: CxxC-x17-CxxC domain-containing protein [Patescibacteria group bacterium]